YCRASAARRYSTSLTPQYAFMRCGSSPSARPSFYSLRWFYATTRLGQAMLAASIDPEGALTMGIDVGRMRTFTFTLGGIVGGLAGALVAPLINIHYEMGLLLTLKGFAAAILGGLMSPFGAIFGGVLLGLVESLAVVMVSSGYKDVVAMTLLIIIMIAMPEGLFGRHGRQGG
ncbi:MAG: branched-chain amino acid ABC transporter permease, partial [Acidobacteriaceae bacterium]|nr:branched-chain amino acid ABC transporter permease [Acidobacteriaceae bacterium]